MLKRVLVANRGEIVCRIARTARRLGVTTLAIYSDADRNARHVREADEAYYVGASPAADSYLNIAHIIEVARRAGADAIHPGYGFLSENAEFADACLAAGMVFIGPPAAAMRAMASKSASKAAMASVGVPVAPGYHGSEQDSQRLTAEAERVGFPLIIKASAGGGGKGMQVVHSLGELAASIESAQRLARTAFGDDRLLLERYFPQARHVEVQIFADTLGSVVALYDRDCSVQRRHQKIIEEAPAPGLRAEVRSAMADAALLAARTVGYVGAGTVEFLLDPAQQFYFMEMNTRLQVEHPVTESITGIDLVEWQLRIAGGEPLPQQSAQIHASGTAIEARLYAEDPAHDYLPSVGTIVHLRWPSELRLDHGVDEGDDVSPFYDPMLGKVIAWGESRTAAIDLLHNGLAQFEILGVQTNRALLLSILANGEFRDSAVATDFLERCRTTLSFGDPAPCDEDFILAALWEATRCTEADALWLDSRGWRLGAAPATTWRFDGATVTVEMSGTNSYRTAIANSDSRVLVLERHAASLAVDLEGRRLTCRVVEHDGRIELFTSGRHVSVTAIRTEDALRAADAAEAGSLLTPLPGTVVALHVAVGETVIRGAPLITIEAMKMEHTLTAPRDGVVSRVIYNLQERVPAGAVLIELSAGQS